MDLTNKNYNEAVIIPYLEKRCKDLLFMSLVMEAQLLAEKEKNKDMQEYIATLLVKLDGLRKTKKGSKVEESLPNDDTY